MEGLKFKSYRNIAFTYSFNQLARYENNDLFYFQQNIHHTQNFNIQISPVSKFSIISFNLLFPLIHPH